MRYKNVPTGIGITSLRTDKGLELGRVISLMISR